MEYLPPGGRTTVFYSHIRPAHGQTETHVIRQAHLLGYELMPFNGWDDADLGASGNHGPRWAEACENGKKLRAIQDACVVHTSDGDDWPHITQTKRNII